MCLHASVVLQSNGTVKDDIPEAEPVTFGAEGIVSRAESVAGMGCLGKSDIPPIKILLEGAVSDETVLAVRLGDTEMFAVRHRQHRSVPGGWAHVETKDVARAVGTNPARSRQRRSTVNPRFRCKVNIVFVVAVFCDAYEVG